MDEVNADKPSLILSFAMGLVHPFAVRVMEQLKKPLQEVRFLQRLEGLGNRFVE
jgi:hypothetical protein